MPPSVDPMSSEIAEVTVIGIPDFWRDGDQWATITIRVLDAYSDDRYDTLFQTVQVRNEDAGLIG